MNLINQNIQLTLNIKQLDTLVNKKPGIQEGKNWQLPLIANGLTIYGTPIRALTVAKTAE